MNLYERQENDGRIMIYISAVFKLRAVWRVWHGRTMFGGKCAEKSNLNIQNSLDAESINHI